LGVQEKKKRRRRNRERILEGWDFGCPGEGGAGR
jgi:hypothetical protein